jgi:Ser/Thr protein kinase RdoA (MazF antagonist)
LNHRNKSAASDFAAVSLPERARITGELLHALHTRYGLASDGDPVDLGGSNNLNLHLPGPDGGWVARVYCPWTSVARLRALQHVRSALVSAGLPFAATVAARDGQTFVTYEGRAIEVERFVAGERMTIGDRLLAGIEELGRIHDVLAGIDVPPAAKVAPFPNHVEADRALEWTRGGTARIRADDPSADGLLAADLADQLAIALAVAELPLRNELPRQLVHGDFWDNNVWFQGDDIVLILDLDFMGERARIDDLALTLYYTNSTLGAGYDDARRIAMLRELVDRYDRGLTRKLSAAERAALPFALARTVLAFVGMLASIDDTAARRSLVREIVPDLQWSFDLVRAADRWQAGFAPR